ncbi:hypothetical protein VIGAN_06124000 [Vigna angularis var. angularis]|uniref:S-protein homolog n=1 Tax=Vigna angularis var. angularis TaxID=157739 RepID=A0A0S3SB27_PHAAN|nr:hypothetical protein VIGAN_06124000 [Vigna angularis var. angularis]
MRIGKGAMSGIGRSVLLLLWFMLLSTCNALGPETTVTVTNSLEGGPLLFLHCKSKDNDLGVQDLRPNASFSWKFGVNFFATTLFHCSFQWERVIHKFVIYDAERDADFCTRCRWIVKHDGPCLILSERKTNCFDWKPNQ